MQRLLWRKEINKKALVCLWSNHMNRGTREYHLNIHHYKRTWPNTHFSIHFLSYFSLSLEAMYYLTLVAYSIYFNSSKVFYFLSLFILALFYMFVLKESVGDTQKFAAWVCMQEARVLFCLKFEESFSISAALHHDSNVSYYRVSVLSGLIAWFQSSFSFQISVCLL